MNSREKKMAITLGVLGGAYVIWQLGLPLINEQLFAIKRENNELRHKLQSLDARLLDVEPWRRLYHEYVARTGFTDATEFKNPFYNKLSELANQAHLGSLRMQPSGIADYKQRGSRKKSGIKEVRFTMNADGPLQAIAGFIRAFYELPYIAQITSLKLDAPSGRARRMQGAVHMRASIEALVPPDHPVGRVNLALTHQPATKIKHKERDYALIWERDPFKEYQAPAPPPRHITRPAVATVPKTPPKPPPSPVGDPAAADKVVRMALIYGGEDRRIDELLVVNTRDLSWEYVAVGEKLDGGVLRLVHPWGAVTRREDGQERMYPIGKTLAESIPLKESTRLYPEVAFAYQELRAKEGENANHHLMPQVGKGPTGVTAEADPTNKETLDQSPSAGKHAGSGSGSGAEKDGGRLPVQGKLSDPKDEAGSKGPEASEATVEEREESSAGEDDQKESEPEKKNDP